MPKPSANIPKRFLTNTSVMAIKNHNNLVLQPCDITPQYTIYMSLCHFHLQNIDNSASTGKVTCHNDLTNCNYIIFEQSDIK